MLNKIKEVIMIKTTYMCLLTLTTFLRDSSYRPFIFAYRTYRAYRALIKGARLNIPGNPIS